MTVQLGRPREFTEAEVLDRALELFWRQGYEATSVRDLTTATGISNSTLYSAFGDKHALYLRVLAHYRRRELAEVERALAGDEPVHVVLGRFFDALVAPSADAQQRGSFALAVAVELSLHDPDVAQQLRDHLDDLTQMFAAFLERGRRRGEVMSPFAAEDLARYLLHNLYSIGTLTAYFPARYRAGQLSTVVLSALAAGPGSAES